MIYINSCLYVSDLSRLYKNLGLCRNEEEAEILLQQKAGYTGILSPYPRLMLAMDTRQKQFVAHYNAQEVRYSILLRCDDSYDPIIFLDNFP